MTGIKNRLLAIVFLFSAILVLVACGGKVEVTGIEISSQPTRVAYVEGEEFDPTGLEVKKVLSDDTKEVITDYEIDKTGSLTLEDKEITITYGKFTATVKITVREAAIIPANLVDIEFKVDEDVEYIRTSELSSEIKYRGLFDDGSYSAWDTLTSEDLSDYVIKDGNLTVTATLQVENKVWTEEVTVPLNDDFITVKELSEKPLDGATHIVEGILVAIGTVTGRVEYILWDDVTNTFIGVSGLATNAEFKDNDVIELGGYKIGDKLRLPVNITKIAENEVNSNSQKVHARYVGGSVYETAIVSRGHKYASVESDVVEITSQEELVDFLTHKNRVNNFYKVVKLSGQMYYARYSGAQSYRFYFDSSISRLADQRVDNVSPVFSDLAHHHTLGETFSKLLFGQDEYAANFNNPATSQHDIYAIFIGGNTYYHQFVILSKDEIIELEEKVIGTELVEPNLTAYELGSEFNLEGAKIVYSYNVGEPTEVELTLEMLDSETLPNMGKAGVYTVTGSYEGFDFSFEVTVIDGEVETLTLNGELTTYTYDHRNTFEEILAELLELDLTVKYEGGFTQTIAITENMVSVEGGWGIGEKIIVIEFLSKSIDIDVTVENKAISVDEFLDQEIGSTHDVNAIVVGPASSHNAIQLLIKDKDSQTVIGVYNSGLAGSTSNVQLNTDYVNEGDEVIMRLTLTQGEKEGTVNFGKVYGNGINTDTSLENLIVVSSGHDHKVNLEEVNVTVIDTQEALVDFLNSPDKFYSIVKLVGVKAIGYNNKSGDFVGYRIFFGDEVTSLGTQKINDSSPFLTENNMKYHLEDGTNKTYFENADSTSYSDPATTEFDIYAIFVGGNSYYQAFAVLGDDWFVKAE